MNKKIEAGLRELKLIRLPVIFNKEKIPRELNLDILSHFSEQADVRPAHVRAQPPQGPRHGAADPQPAGPQGVRLQGRGRVSRVSNE